MSDVSVEQVGKVSVVKINRPSKRNAISQRLALQLQSAFHDFDASDQRVAVLTGAGKEAFSGGADINQLPKLWRSSVMTASRSTSDLRSTSRQRTSLVNSDP